MKLKKNPYLASCLLAVALACSASAADLTWNNGASTGNWNTTDANWSGASWTAGDNAFFNSPTGTINLTQAISAGNLTFGTSGGSGVNNTGSFAGSALTLSGNLTAIANGNNGPGGPTLSFSNNVSVAGDVSIGRRVLEVTSGTFTANRILSADSWGRLLISGGTVTATNGIDDSINGGNTLSVVLSGGSLYTPYIRTTSAGNIGPLPNDGVVLSGGTLYATANSNDFIQTYSFAGNRNDIGVGTGGANINTNGFDITITKTMINYGGAGTLSKSGSGALTLTAANTFTGNTLVSAGKIVLGNASALQNSAYDTASINGGLDLNGNASITLGGLTGSANLSSSLITGYGNVTGLTLNPQSGSTNTYSGIISNGSGALTLTKGGAGTQVLSGNNTYSGVTVLSGGILSATSIADNGVSSSIGVGTGDTVNENIGLLFRGGTLQYSGSTAQSTNRQIRLSTTGGGGTIDASGSDPSATLTFTAPTSINFFEGPGNRTLTLAGSNTGTNTFATAIGQAGGVTSVVKSGGGRWMLTGTSNYSGVTTLAGGTLNAATIADNGTASSLGVGTGDTNNENIGLLFRGGTLQYTGSTAQSTNRQIRLFTSGGSIDASGSNVNATLSFTHSAANTNFFDSPGTRTLTLTGSNTGNNSFAIRLEDQGSNVTSLVKSGAGKWVLSGASTYGGQTDITAGMLVAASSTALGVGGHNGATMSWIRDGATLGLQGGISLNEHFHVWGAGVDGLGAIRNISGNNALTNAPVDSPGYALRSNTTIGVDADTLTISGFYNGDGGSYGITKTGQGSLTLSGNNTYTGATNVTGGTLVVNGTISSSSLTTVASGATLGGSGTVGALTISTGGSINPGNSPGILNVNGAYNQAGTLIAEITGTTPGTGHDQINVTGSVNLSGALTLDVTNAGTGYVLNSMIFLILNDGVDAVTGAFSNYAQGASVGNFGGFDWIITYQADSTTSSFTGGNDVALRAIPEASTALLGGLGALGLLRRRRNA